MGKIAVIGGTGHFGSKAIDFLIERGVTPSDIVVMYRNEKKALPFKDRGMEIRYGDYQKGYEPDAFKGIEKVLFVSGFELDPIKRIKDHVVIVEAVRNAKVSQIVYTSFANPYEYNYGLEDVHLATEFTIKASGIPYTLLRNTFYSEYYINKMYMKRSFDSGILYTLAKGRGVNFVSRDDMARCAAVVLTTEGHLNKTYTLTSPKWYTYKDIAQDLSEVSGKKIELVETNIEDYKVYMDKIGIPKEAQFFDTVVFQQRFVDGWGEICSQDLANLIGEENITTPRQFIEKIDVAGVKLGKSVEDYFF